jgi:hypothetical protein
VRDDVWTAFDRRCAARLTIRLPGESRGDVFFKRQSVKKESPMQKLVLLIAFPACLAGCAQDATFTNPADGKSGTCTSSYLPDINIWSNYPLCLEQYVSAGYQRVR